MSKPLEFIGTDCDSVCWMRLDGVTYGVRDARQCGVWPATKDPGDAVASPPADVAPSADALAVSPGALRARRELWEAQHSLRRASRLLAAGGHIRLSDDVDGILDRVIAAAEETR